MYVFPNEMLSAYQGSPESNLQGSHSNILSTVTTEMTDDDSMEAETEELYRGLCAELNMDSETLEEA